MDKITLYKPSNKTDARLVIAKYQSEITKLQKLFGIDGLKHCTVCNEDKPIEQFHAKQGKCKTCNKAYFNHRYHERQKIKNELEQKKIEQNK
jgi:hypothetical protein